MDAVWIVLVVCVVGFLVWRRAVLRPVAQILRTGQMPHVIAIEGVRHRAKGGITAIDVVEAERTRTGERVVMQHPSGDRYEFTVTVR